MSEKEGWEHPNNELMQAGDKYGLDMKEHEANGYDRGYKDASAHYQKMVHELTKKIIHKYHEGFNNGYSDGYDVRMGGVGSRLNPPKIEEINKAMTALFEMIDNSTNEKQLKP